MSTHAEGFAPGSPVLDPAALASLPDHLGSGARQALALPRSHSALASVTVGRLLRSGDARGSRAALARWLGSFDVPGVEVLGGLAEQIAHQLLLALRGFAGRHEGAGAALEAANVEGASERAADHEPRPAEASSPGWLWRALEQRDDLESLVVVLGTIALEHGDEPVAERAAFWEGEAQGSASQVDRLSSMLSHVLGDELGDRGGSPWLERMRALQPRLWWLGMLASRAKGRRAPLAEPQAAKAENVIPFRMRLPEAPRRMAAHGAGQEAPPSMEEEHQGVHQGLTYTVSERPTEQGGSHLMLRLYGWNDTPVDFRSEGAVRVTDEKGAERGPLEQGSKDRRWWGVFEGSGVFVVHIAGLGDPLVLHVTRQGR